MDHCMPFSHELHGLFFPDLRFQITLWYFHTFTDLMTGSFVIVLYSHCCIWYFVQMYRCLSCHAKSLCDYNTEWDFLGWGKFEQIFFNCLILTVSSLEIQLLERRIVIPIIGLTPPHFCACPKITYTACKHIMTQHSQIN